MSPNTTDHQEVLDQKAAADAFLARAAEMKKRTSWFAASTAIAKERRSQRASEIIPAQLTKELTEEMQLSDSDNEDENVTEATMLTTEEEIIVEQGEEALDEEYEEDDWGLSDEEYEEYLEDDCPDAKIPIVAVGEGEGVAEDEGEGVAEEEEEEANSMAAVLNRGCSKSTISETDSGWSNGSDDLDDDFDDDEDNILPVQPAENNKNPVTRKAIKDVNDSVAVNQEEEENTEDRNNEIKAVEEGRDKNQKRSSRRKAKKKNNNKKKKHISKRPSFNWETMTSEDDDSLDDRLDWLPSEIELERTMMAEVWEEDRQLPSSDDLLKRIEALEQELQEEKRQRENLHEELLEEQALCIKATSDRCNALELEVQEQTKIIVQQQDMILGLMRHCEEEQKQRKAMESKILGLIEDLRFRSEIRKEWMIQEVERNKNHIRAQQKRANIRDGICPPDPESIHLAKSDSCYSVGSLGHYLDKSNPDHHQDSTSNLTESSSTVCAGNTTKESESNEPSIKLCPPSDETEEYFLGFPEKRMRKPSKRRASSKRKPGPVVEDPIPRSQKEVQPPSTRRKSKRLSLPTFLSLKPNTSNKADKAKPAKNRRASTGISTRKEKQNTAISATHKSPETSEEHSSTAPLQSKKTRVSSARSMPKTTNPMAQPKSIGQPKKSSGQGRRVSSPPRINMEAWDRLSVKYRAAALKMQLGPFMDNSERLQCPVAA